MHAEGRRIVAICLALFLLLAGATEADAARKKKPDPGELSIEQWLVLGPAVHPLPVFSDDEKGGYDLAKLLEETLLPATEAKPADGESIDWFGGSALQWRLLTAGRKADLRLSAPESAGEKRPGVAWLVSYVSTSRWQSVNVKLAANHPARLWLDGDPITTAAATQPVEGEDPQPATGKLELAPGSHRLWIQTLFDPTREADWDLRLSLTSTDEEAGSSPPVVELGLDPTRNVEIRDILDAPQISSVAVAPDGRQVALSITRTVPGTHESETWIEVRDLAGGESRETWRGSGTATLLDWSPDGRYISYVAPAGGENLSTLFLYERRTGQVRPLIERVERFGGYLWSPQTELLAYWVTEKSEPHPHGIKRLEGLMDRWAGYRDKEHLYLATVPGAARRRLTAGALGAAAADFSPDGKRLLFTRRLEQYERRPYSITELWELDLESFNSRKLRDFDWFGGAQFSPDGKRLLVQAQPSEFGDAGLDVPEGQIANSYDAQLFIWDPVSDEAEGITRKFDPSVSSASWNSHDGKIYLRAEDRDYRRVYVYDPDRRRFSTLDTGVEATRRFEPARNAAVAVGTGSSVWTPQSLFLTDLETGQSRTLEHPAEAWFSGVRKGRVESWSFTASSGAEVDGRVYLPANFDAERKYPCIVYYYGGTSPVGRDFGGRYPKEWWAAHGYVVYVLQPTGATGFGQSKSAVHVNDWGKTTSDEIIEGTRKFLEAHPYVDPAKVGCIGASYGGFMTMLLTTRTDLFAAAVAHAGISSISSYWGEGYWGYSYSSVATAESFPWNRPDIYVDQSPLFRADKHQVPLLLTHGSADTNVPVGESDQFYVALKLLGKDVEYLQVEGENHWIVSHEKRLYWSNSIMAWFDRWLKDDPAWWDHLYGK